jgi:glycosyltransferase involved in cell wall biosynthesis
VIDEVRQSREALLNRYRGFDLFASASLGEGLGLPVAEAILAGLPVLANDWGGHRDLLRAGAFFPIPHAVVPQPFCSRPDYYAPGQRCAVASVEGIAQALRRAARTSVTTRLEMAERARLALLGRFGQRRVAQRLAANRSVVSLRDVGR